MIKFNKNYTLKDKIKKKHITIKPRRVGSSCMHALPKIFILNLTFFYCEKQ